MNFDFSSIFRIYSRVVLCKLDYNVAIFSHTFASLLCKTSQLIYIYSLNQQPFSRKHNALYLWLCHKLLLLIYYFGNFGRMTSCISLFFVNISIILTPLIGNEVRVSVETCISVYLIKRVHDA